jgi:hypothetical protein
VHALRAAKVASARTLGAVWLANPGFLKPQLMDWMRSGQGHVLEREWPRIVASVTAPRKGGGAPGKKGHDTAKGCA